jgi:peptidoglycan/LPS O-acetylase OafA/YrhL
MGNTETPSERSRRLPELDILRAFAICLIVFSHFPPLSTLYIDVSTRLWCATFGLALFLFLSGFSLHRSNRITSAADVLLFYKKRIIRIYPLYVLIIAVYVLLQVVPLSNSFLDTTLTPGEIAVNVIGLQALLNTPSYNALWFIGLILTFYLIYPVMMLASSEKTVRIIIFSCAALALFAYLRIAFNIVNLRLIYYYVLFVGGILASKALLTHTHRSHFSTRRSRIVYLIGALPLLGIAMAFYQQNLGETGELISFYANMANYVPKALISFLFISCALCAARVVTMTFNKCYYAPLLFISFLSYSIYLVHPLVLTACTRAQLVAPQLTGAQNDAILIFIGIPAIVLAAYLLQKCGKILTFRLRLRGTSEYRDPQTQA